MSTEQSKPFASIITGYVVKCEMNRIGKPRTGQDVQDFIDGVFERLTIAFEGSVIGGMYDSEANIIYYAFLDEKSAKLAADDFNVARRIFDDFHKN